MSYSSTNQKIKKDVDKIILKAKPIREKERDVVGEYNATFAFVDASQLKKLFNKKKLGTRDISIAFSHDDYLTNNGGIQKCIQIEENVARNNGIDYLHIYPAIPRTWIVDDSISGTIPLGLNLNGESIAITNAIQLVDALQHYSPNSVKSIVHSPLGHNLEDIKKISSSLHGHINWYFWLHDFTTLCTSVHLLRNDAAYCGAPDKNSMQCGICHAGEDRQQQIKAFTHFFKATNPIVLSPSIFMKNFWLDKADFQHSCIRVVEHYSFGESTGVQTGTIKEIRIAFVGTPAFHKGWNDFIDLIENLQKEPTFFSFYVFASHAPESSLYQQKKVIIKADKNKTMSKQLAENHIDIAFVGSIWPETFCLTAFEALAADAFLVANSLSGNVVNLIKETNKGYIYRGLNDLITYLKDKNVQQHILNRRLNKHYHELIASEMTYS